MQDSKSLFKILDGWHHLRERLHLREHVDQGLRVVKPREYLLGQRLLNIVHGFLLCLRGGNGWVLLCLQLADSPFQGIDQVLVLTGDPHFLFDAERS